MQVKILFIGVIFFLVDSCRTEDPSDYDAWDVDRDETLNSNEFSNAYKTLNYYNKWDLNDDGHLDENEWEKGMSSTYPDQNNEFYGKFQDWDLNGDGWLSDEEFTDNSFSAIDTNKDSTIDREEFNKWFEQRE